MDLFDIIFIGIALSMDAFAVSMTNGMVEPQMKLGKALLIALFFGVFQLAMPLLGFFVSGIFSSVLAQIAPWLSFALLGFLGGKMIFDSLHESSETERGKLTLKKLAVQAVATSIDALAVGVSFLALSAAGELPLNIYADVSVIGCITFSLSLLAVYLGKVIGDKFSSRAELAGGIVLVVIGLKILLESFF